MEKYVLITAVRNESKFIAITVNGVINQTVKPVRWVIVNDNSSDQTGDILSQLINKVNFITVIERKSKEVRGVGSKVQSIKIALDTLKIENYQYIGILDGDIELPSNYYERMIEKLEEDKLLGVIGGTLSEIRNGKKYISRSGTHHVIGAVQFFKRRCFDEIGGIPILHTVGEDSAALIAARIAGWKTETIRDIKFEHLKPTGVSLSSAIEKGFKLGVGDFNIGVSVLFAIGKYIRRLFWRPIIIYGSCYAIGYLYSFVFVRKHEVSTAFIKKYKKEQMKRFTKIKIT